ncbi:unnamed protein product, partial [Meganyctiphanes norvegica]
MSAVRGGAKDRLVHEIGRAIKQAQIEWCSAGCVRPCTGRWLVLSLDAALLHGLHNLTCGYWSLLSSFLDKTSLKTINSLPYATTQLSRGRAWLCLCLNEGQLESYLHVLSSHHSVLGKHYASGALLRDPHRANIMLMMAAGLEHIKLNISMDIPGWIASGGSVGSSSSSSLRSLDSCGSSLPSPTSATTPHLSHDMVLATEALEDSWGSKKKRRSTSSTRSSSQMSSGDTTPSEPCSQQTFSRVNNQRVAKQEVNQELQDFNGIKPKNNCDIKISKDSIIQKEMTMQKSGSREKSVENDGDKLEPIDSQYKSFNDFHVKNDINVSEKNIVKENGENEVVRRGQLPNLRNVEKRVSFTGNGDNQQLLRKQSNRTSWCVGSESELGDLSDLRELLNSLRGRGLLPPSFSVDELFTSLDQINPSLSERAPPEGQEDPPLHQSITSLTMPNNNNNSDDSNNNNKQDDLDEAITNVSDTSTEKDDVIGGIRVEELTKMGQKILSEDGQLDHQVDGLQDDISSCSSGARPKVHQRNIESSPVVPSATSTPQSANKQQQNSYRSKGSSEKLRRGKRYFRRETKLPSLHIPIKVDPELYKEEEQHLEMEIAQGQSNMVVAGDPQHHSGQQYIEHHFTDSEETVYRVFPVREGHSSGKSISVLVVISNQCLYVMNPVSLSSKPRHTLPFHEIHSVVVGANDQWLCIVSKKCVHEGVFEAYIGETSCGLLQLDVGDTDITHSIISCLEVAMRRRAADLRCKNKSQNIESFSDESFNNEDLPLAISQGISSESITDSMCNFYESALENTENDNNIILNLESVACLPWAPSHKNWSNGSRFDHLLPSIIVHPAWELVGLRRWLRSQLRLQELPVIYGSWLVDWEDGSSLGSNAAAGPLGPSMEGPLMVKQPGMLSPWRPAYFILKAGVLYQFNDASERVPHSMTEITNCVGCVRTNSSPRPHAFQVFLNNPNTVQLSYSKYFSKIRHWESNVSINSSEECEVSERGQVTCCLVLLDSGVSLIKQTDLFLGPPPETPEISLGPSVSNSDAQFSSAVAGAQKPPMHPSAHPSSKPSLPHKVSTAPVVSERPVNISVSTLRNDHRGKSSSMTSLHRANSLSSLVVPPSPSRKIKTVERNVSMEDKFTTSLQRHGSSTHLVESGNISTKQTSARNEMGSVRDLNMSRKTSVGRGRASRKTSQGLVREQIPKGELKVLSFSSLEQLSAISVYSECPKSCLMEFECSEAGEISGDWTMYFRSVPQLQVFLTALADAYEGLHMGAVPLGQVDDAGIQEFLLEGSRISAQAWAPPYHLP